jgi:membrane fusion protein (multidrug efflux system)
MNPIHKVFTSIALAAIPALFTGCSQSATQEPEEQAPPSVEVIRLKKGGTSSSLKIPGELSPYQNVDLYAKVSSFVRKIYVDVGSFVKEGTLLASLEAPEFESQLAGAESRLKAQEAVYISSKANYERLLETSKTPGTVSPNDLDQAFSRQQSDAALLESAKASFREIEDTRRYLEIRAPFSGVISARNVSPGAYVGPSGKGSEVPLFSLVDQERLRLVLSIPEAYTHYIARGAGAEFSVKSLPGQSFEAQINRLAGALDNRLRAQRVELDVFNTDKKLLPGMIAEVTVPVNTSDSSFSVPVTSLLNSTLGTYVIRVKDKKAQWVPVTTGRNDAAQVEIIGDIREGDMLVKHVTEEIRDASEIGLAVESAAE